MYFLFDGVCKVPSTNILETVNWKPVGHNIFQGNRWAALPLCIAAPQQPVCAVPLKNLIYTQFLFAVLPKGGLWIGLFVVTKEPPD